jgi:hypothetical protein
MSLRGGFETVVDFVRHVLQRQRSGHTKTSITVPLWFLARLGARVRRSGLYERSMAGVCALRQSPAVTCDHQRSRSSMAPRPHLSAIAVVVAVAIAALDSRHSTAAEVASSEGLRLFRHANPSHKPRSHDTSRIAWAKLMARVGEEFPRACPTCGGDIRLREDGRQEPAHFEPEVRKRAKARMASPA